MHSTHFLFHRIFVALYLFLYLFQLQQIRENHFKLLLLVSRSVLQKH